MSSQDPFTNDPSRFGGASDNLPMEESAEEQIATLTSRLDQSTAENQQLRGRLGEAGQAGEHRVDQDGERHRTRAAPPIGDHAEQQSAHGPSDQCDAERPSAPHADLALRRAWPEQFGHRAILDEHHQEHVHQVEHPSEIGDQQHEDLPPANDSRRRGGRHAEGLPG